MLKIANRYSAFVVLAASIVAAAGVAVSCSSEPETTLTVVEPTVSEIEATVPVPDRTAMTAAAPEVVSSPEPTATMGQVPSATATLSPLPTVAPELQATSTPTQTVEDFNYVGSLATRVYDKAVVLAEDVSPRQSATEEELQAAGFLMDEMTELGYETSMQDFEVTEAWGSGTLEILSEAANEDPAVKFRRPDSNSARVYVLPFEPSKSGIIEGEIVDVGLGTDEDFEGIYVAGKIALMGRGDVTFEEKETNAAENGAIGAVVYNNEPKYYFSGRLERESDILVGGISMEDGEILFDALEDGETLNAELIVYPLGNGPSRNVIAELNNDIVGDQVVLIGAHYDTTAWSPGSNDNGSGVAAVLVLAEELADDELPFDLRLVFFGSEETGLHGSTFYVNDLSVSQLGRIEAMINLDVVATGELSALGSEVLVEYADEAADALGFDIEVTTGLDGASSDHAPFDELGVSVVMVYADDLTYINHPSDTIQHLNSEPMGQAVAVVLGIIDRLAGSIEP